MPRVKKVRPAPIWYRCPDDIIRSECPKCKRTYEPIGYSDDPDYGHRWSCIDWSGMVERRTIVTKV